MRKLLFIALLLAFSYCSFSQTTVSILSANTSTVTGEIRNGGTLIYTFSEVISGPTDLQQDAVATDNEYYRRFRKNNLTPYTRTLTLISQDPNSNLEGIVYTNGTNQQGSASEGGSGYFSWSPASITATITDPGTNDIAPDGPVIPGPPVNISYLTRVLDQFQWDITFDTDGLPGQDITIVIQRQGNSTLSTWASDEHIFRFINASNSSVIAIPTLSQWGLIILALGMMIFRVVTIQNRKRQVAFVA